MTMWLKSVPEPGRLGGRERVGNSKTVQNVVLLKGGGETEPGQLEK